MKRWSMTHLLALGLFAVIVISKAASEYYPPPC